MIFRLKSSLFHTFCCFFCLINKNHTHTHGSKNDTVLEKKEREKKKSNARKEENNGKTEARPRYLMLDMCIYIQANK